MSTKGIGETLAAVGVVASDWGGGRRRVEFLGCRGVVSCESQSQHDIPGRLMNLPLDQLEAVPVVERPSDGVFLEHFHLQISAHVPGMVHQAPPDTHTVKIRIQEDCPDLVSDERDKADDRSFLFPDPGVRIRKVYAGNVEALVIQEVGIQERMRDRRGSLPRPYDVR